MLKTLLLLTLASHAVQDAPKLSASAEQSKAAFASLMKLTEGVSEARLTALRLPGTPEYLSSPEGMMGFFALNQSLTKAPDKEGESYRLYAGLLPKMDHLRGWDGYQTTYLAREARRDTDPALAERVRRESANLIKRTIAKHEFYGPIADMSVKLYPLDLAHLEGPGLRGMLVDRPAPAMKFLWCSDPRLKKLSDLFPGKVVVLDFWATWCKPCVGLFPKIREISASYEGKPVVFVGVTSLQGFSIDPKLGRVDCKGDPKKEIALMPGIMQQLGVTWKIAFSDKDCFNPDFDIMEIPHMAVLDQKGIVRYDGIEPDDLKAKIDGLLSGRKESTR